jgi:DUF4097 and DUF4098 domain-containing protein YvlB
MCWHSKTQSWLQALAPKTYLANFAVVVIVYCASALTQTTHEFHQTIATSIAQPVSLKVELLEGDLEIAYSREGKVSVYAVGQAATGSVPVDFLASLLSITSAENRIEIRQQRSEDTFPSRIKITYRIDVPYWTEVSSLVKSGKQTITGIMGPVSAEVNNGDLRVSYIAKTVVAHATAGNLDLQVIGDRVEANTGRGNISCSRTAQGVSAETGDGDISLMVVGPSEAKVRQGSGRVDAGGVRGTLIASTDDGDLHVKAVPHDNWRLSSVSGAIRLELPLFSSFDLDAMTNFGELVIGRDDLFKPNAEVRQFTQRVNGGGKRVEVRSKSGRIVVS